MRANRGGPRATAVVACVLLAAGCAGRISPQTVRGEIVRQTGASPARELELTMGRLTTALVKRALGPDASGALPLSGLAAVEIAVYGLPAAPTSAAEAVDVSRMAPWGWEPVVRYKDAGRSALVMIRGRHDVIRDLALVAAGGGEVVYGRLRGRLPATLPAAIRSAVARDGTVSLKRQLLDVAGLKEEAARR